MFSRLSRSSFPFFQSRWASYSFTVQKRYFDLILEGKKTVEGRLNQKKYQKIKVGDLVSFKSSEPSDPLSFCIIREKKIYRTFKDMLEAEGMENCLPDASSLDEAISIYHAFPGYREKSPLLGVIAFKLEKKT